MGEMSNAEALKRVLKALDAAGIPYMIVGSFASSHYGPYRSTRDIDIVITATPAQLRVFIETLPAAEYYRDLESAMEAHKRRDMFNILDMVTGFKTDLIFLKAGDFDQEAFRRRRVDTIEGIPIYISSPEDVIIAKLEWARMGSSLRQIEDVSGLLRTRWNSLDHSYLKKWVAQLGLDSQWNSARQAAGPPIAVPARYT